MVICCTSVRFPVTCFKFNLHANFIFPSSLPFLSPFPTGNKKSPHLVKIIMGWARNINKAIDFSSNFCEKVHTHTEQKVRILKEAHKCKNSINVLMSSIYVFFKWKFNTRWGKFKMIQMEKWNVYSACRSVVKKKKKQFGVLRTDEGLWEPQ